MFSEVECEYGVCVGSVGFFLFLFDEGKEYSIVKYVNIYGVSDGYNFILLVGSFLFNVFGVYDMYGNVYEWVVDCWYDYYNGVLSDGSVWMEDKCELVQICGNDWGELLIFLCLGNCNNVVFSDCGDWIGFCVVCEF